MRQGYRSLTKNISKQFNNLLNINLRKHKEDQDNIEFFNVDTLIRVELMLTGFLLATGQNKAGEAWAILPGYNFSGIADGLSAGIAGRLRQLFGFYRVESQWIRDLREYEKIDLDYRLYNLTEDEVFSEQSVRYLPERKTQYVNLLNKPVPYKKRSLPFAQSGIFSYQRFAGLDKRTIEGEIPELKHDQTVFPLQRQKKDLTCDFQTDWVGLGEEMDQTAGGGDWFGRLASFQIQSVWQGTVLHYSGINHLAGGLGTGKSTYRMAETYRLVRKHQAKIGLLEGTVAEVIRRVEELRKFGIDAVPIIGPSGRNRHLKNYLLAHAKEVKVLSEWNRTSYSSLRHLSGKCFIQALSGDAEGGSNYPCTQLFQDNKQVQCSFASGCGIYDDFQKLITADVWVTTSAAVLKTKLPSMLDPYERTIFEAMYDLLDVIFIDEADQVQQQFDDTFMEEYDLFGSPRHLLEELENELSSKITGRYSDLAGNTLILNFRRNLAELTNIIWQIFELLNNSPRLRTYLSNHKVFHIYALAHELTKKLAESSSSSDQIWEKMKSYISNPFLSEGLSQAANKLLDPNGVDSKDDLLHTCIQALSEKLNPKLDSKLLLLQLEFFLYLGRFEIHLKYILQYAEVIFEELNISSPLGKVFNMRKGFSPFMKEGMTGMMVGYRYLKQENPLGSFKFFEYSGVGRLLLQEWRNVFQYTDDIPGPGIVFLSGTSYAPGSRHHDMQLPVDWLIKTQYSPGKIEQFFHPLTDPVSGEWIKVSGLPISGERQGNLEKEVEQLKPLLRHELEHWIGERRVLLVVNSYEDLELVAAVLQRDPQLRHNFKVLSRGSQEEEDKPGTGDSYYYPLATIEQFKMEKAEILVAPLLAMNRGHNILADDHGALFGSVFFLIRPYPVPDDLSYMIEALHAQLPGILANIKKDQLTGSKAVRQLRKTSILRLESMVRKPDYWAILNDDERKALSWFILVPVWQMIGRLLRGGRDARVFYTDAKFGLPTESASGVIPPLLSYWRTMLDKYKTDEVVQSLYGPFLSSLPVIKYE